MTRLLLLLFLVLVADRLSAQTIQLALPQTPSSRLFASDTATVTFDFRMNGAEVRYTTDGSEPNSGSTIYTNPLKINGLATIKAKSFKQGFLPSETVNVELVQTGRHHFDSIAISPSPKKYMANGWRTLCDKQLGDDNFRQNWLGFNGKEAEFELFFHKKQKASQVSVSLLQQQGAWIFLPQKIEIYDKKGRLLSSQILPKAANEQAPGQEITNLNFPRRRYKTLKIKLIALSELPSWHSGKGNTGWFFLDEIMTR